MVIVEDEGERFWYSDSEKLDGHCRCLTNMLPHILRTDFQTKKAKRKTTYWSLNFVPSVIRGNQHILNKAMVIGNWPMVVSLWWPTFNKPVLFFFCLRWISLIRKYLRMRSYHERILWTRVYTIQCTLESRKNLGQIPRLIGNSIISPVQHLEIWTLRSSPSSSSSSSWASSSSL